MRTPEERRGKFVWSMNDVMVLYRAADVHKHEVDDEGHEGVWRTIRGRKVFIREGESPTQAVLRDIKTRPPAIAPQGTLEEQQALKKAAGTYNKIRAELRPLRERLEKLENDLSVLGAPKTEADAEEGARLVDLIHNRSAELIKAGKEMDEARRKVYPNDKSRFDKG